MKYYTIKYKIERRDVGAYPQCQKLAKGFSPSETDYIYNVFCGRAVVDADKYPHIFTCKYPVYRTTAKVRTTDFLSHVISNFPLCSLDAIQLLSDFNLSGFKTYPCYIEHKGELLEYYLLIPEFNFSKYLIWSKCVFTIDDTGEVFKGVNSKQDWIDISSKLFYNGHLYLSIKKIYLNKDFPLEQDLFFLKDVDSYYYYFSESLKDALINSHLSGFEFSKCIEVCIDE